MDLRFVKIILKVVLFVFILTYVVECNTQIQSPQSEKFSADLPPLWGRLGSSGKIKECAHTNTTYGKRTAGDLLMHVEVIRIGKRMLRQTTAQVQFPSGGKKNDCNITQITVQNLRKECNCFNDNTNLVNGGVGAKFFNLTITSGTGCPIEHKVSCFTKCG